jgi:hypothetical protein
MKVNEIINKLRTLPQDLDVYTDFGINAHIGEDALPITYVDVVETDKGNAVLLSAFWKPGERELFQPMKGGAS